MFKLMKKNMWGKTIKNENFIILLLFAFVIINWLMLLNVTKLVTPDYYRYFSASKKILSGDFHLHFIPPLYPFLLIIIGKILSFAFINSDPFILGAKLISLISGLGLIFCFYRLLKKLIGMSAIIAIFIMMISPLFLFMISFPTTDMLFMFLVILFFYFYFNNKKIFLVINSFVSSLVRFEGIILIFLGIMSFLKLKIKHIFYYLAILLIICPGIYLLSLKFTQRLIIKVNIILQNKTYLLFLKYPKKLINIIYDGVFNFLPYNLSTWVIWIIFSIFIVFVVIGFYFLIKKNIYFGLSIFFYEIIFVLAKGYIIQYPLYRNLPANAHLRRMLPFIYIVLLVSFVGIKAFFDLIKNYKKENIILLLKIFIYVFLIFLILKLKIATKLVWTISTIFLLPIIIFTINNIQIKKLEKLFLIILTFIVSTNIYSLSYKRAYFRLRKSPHIGGYYVAQWINKQDKKTPLKIYTNSYIPMIKYYLKRKAILIYKPYGANFIKKNKKAFVKYFLLTIKREKIDYLIFDVYTISQGDVELKKTIFELAKKNKELRIKDVLTYEGKYIATIIKSNNEESK